MAVRITSDILLNGNTFLDSRQNRSSLNDLLNWDFEEVVIPDGFEVCVNGEWYIYRKPKEGEETVKDIQLGYFRKRDTSDDSENIVREGLVFTGKTLGTIDMPEDKIQINKQ